MLFRSKLLLTFFMFQAIFYNLADSNKLIDAFIAGTYKSLVQEKVKSAIENMTGLEVADVNIHIASVDMENEKGK